MPVKFYVKVFGLLIVMGLLYPSIKWWDTFYKASLQNYKQSVDVCLTQAADTELNIRLKLKGHKFVTWFEQYWDTQPYVTKTIEFEDTVYTVTIKKDDPQAQVKLRQFMLKDYLPLSIPDLDSLFSICINENRDLVKYQYLEYIDIKKNDTIKTNKSRNNNFDNYNVVSDIDTLDIIKTIGVRAHVRIPVLTILKDNFKDMVLPNASVIFCIIGTIIIVTNLTRKHKKDFNFFHKASQSNEKSFREIVDQMNEMYQDMDDDTGLKSKLIHISKEIDEQAWYNGRFWRYLDNEAGKIRFMMGPTYLYPMLMELKTKYESTGSKKVSVAVKCPEDMLIVTDENHLRSILVELLNNSVRFSDETVHIDLSAHIEKNVTFINVRDNGWGIPKNEQDHIFEHGHQIQSHIERLNDDSGMGLGLAYVESFVSAMGGGIMLMSIEGELTIMQLTFGITDGYKTLISRHKAIMQYFKK